MSTSSPSQHSTVPEENMPSRNFLLRGRKKNVHSMFWLFRELPDWLISVLSDLRCWHRVGILRMTENIGSWEQGRVGGLLLFSSVQSLSRVWLFVTPWIAARQASLSITNSQSLLKLMSIESVMPSNHHILSRPLLLLPPIPPNIRVFSDESTLQIRWPKVLEFQLQHQSFQWTPRTDLL